MRVGQLSAASIMVQLEHDELVRCGLTCGARGSIAGGEVKILTLGPMLAVQTTSHRQSLGIGLHNALRVGFRVKSCGNGALCVCVVSPCDRAACFKVQELRFGERRRSATANLNSVGCTLRCLFIVPLDSFGATACDLLDRTSSSCAQGFVRVCSSARAVLEELIHSGV